VEGPKRKSKKGSSDRKPAPPEQMGGIKGLTDSKKAATKGGGSSIDKVTPREKANSAPVFGSEDSAVQKAWEP